MDAKIPAHENNVYVHMNELYYANIQHFNIKSYFTKH